MSTLVLGVFGTEDNGTVMVRRDGQTIRLPLPRNMRDVVQQSIGGMLPENVAQSLLGQQALAPRSINYDNTTTFPDGGRGSAYDPATGSFPPTPAGAAGPATVPSTVSEQLLAGADPGVPEVATREATASEQLMAPAGLASSPFPLRRPARTDSPVDYRALARTIALQERVDPELFVRLVNQESRFNPSARSSAGALGLAQLMPATAEELGVDPLDPEQNLRGGARYLRQQIDAFDGDLRLGLAAYNAGAGAVRRHGGVPPFTETQDYVTAILNGYTPREGGHSPESFPPPPRPSPDQPTRADVSTAPAPASAGPQSRMMPSLSPGERLMQGVQEIPERVAGFVSNIPERVSNFVDTLPERISDFAANPGEALAGLDDLPDALQFLELFDNTPQMRVPAPPPIIRPRGGSGSQAIQRMGLRSLA